MDKKECGAHGHTQTHTEEYFSAIEKDGNFVIYNNMDATWGPYAEWNKLDRERQKLYDLTYM